MYTNIRYVVLTAIRDRLFIGLFLGLIFAAFVSSIMGSTALLEAEQMTLTFAAASVRAIIAVGLIVFACFHLRAAFQTKEIDVLLSRPISRTNLVISYWLGFALVATLLVIPTLAIIWVVGIIDQDGFWAWSLSLLLEGWLVVAISLFAGFTLSSAVSAVLLSLGFYILSRMIGFFTATAENGVLFSDATLNNSFEWVIDVVSVLIPRLDFFAKSEWLIYGLKGPSDFYLFVIQGAVFIPLLMAATVIDFKRKEF